MNAFLNRIPLLQLRRLAGAGVASLALAFAACGDGERSAAENDDSPPFAVAPEALSQALLAQLDRYEEAMEALIELIENSDDAAAVEASTRELVELSLPLLEGLPAVRPMCADYLAAAAGLMEVLETISEDEIEEDFHKDGALPATDSALCYHVKDLLVHPATVLVLLREEGLEARRDDMKQEIIENRAHLGAVRAAL